MTNLLFIVSSILMTLPDTCSRAMSLPRALGPIPCPPALKGQLGSAGAGGTVACPWARQRGGWMHGRDARGAGEQLPARQRQAATITCWPRVGVAAQNRFPGVRGGCPGHPVPAKVSPRKRSLLHCSLRRLPLPAEIIAGPSARPNWKRPWASGPL